MGAQPFSATLRIEAEPIWRKELQHPFVRGLADGSLPVERFRFYLRQDYVFLIDYCRVFALAAAKARDLKVVELFANLLHDTLTTEMDLHREYCRRLGIAPHELTSTAAAPITHAYTRHLLTAAYSGSIAEIVAAVLPCQLGYAELGAALVRDYRDWTGSTYADWIRMYSAAEFAAGADQLRRLLDELTADWPEASLEPLEGLFLTSSRYEYLFWEMSYTEADWPI
jgi:thiaminase (transcriptional activator TenA)